MTTATAFAQRSCAKAFCAGLAGAAFALLAASSALAQNAPPAGTIAEGSLKGKTLTFVSYGGIYQDGQNAALKEFADKSGVKLLNDGPTELAKLQAQIESGNVTWDVVDTGDLAPFAYCGKYFQKLDFTKIDVSHIPPGQVGPCSVPAMNYGIVLMYKTDKFKDHPPKNWKDFFDTKNFPGTRGIDGSGDPPVGLLEQALLADGHPVDKLTPADIDTAIARIKALGPDTVFWKTGAESQQLAESGEIDMLLMWTGRAMTAVKNGAKYTPVWQDWLVVKDQLAIPVGVKDPAAAHALINAYLGKSAQEALTQKTSYSPVNNESKPQVDAQVQAFLTNTPERVKQGYGFNTAFWTENFEALNEKWGSLLAGN